MLISPIGGGKVAAMMVGELESSRVIPLIITNKLKKS
jgi:hypothetical protein